MPASTTTTTTSTAGRDFYGSIITTRTYDDRLAKRCASCGNAGIKVCCGGILGMGETHADRIDLLWELARQEPYPESVPINTLVPVGAPRSAISRRSRGTRWCASSPPRAS